MKSFKNNIWDFIKSGSKKSQKLGIEIEHFVLDKNDKSVFYEYQTNKPGIKEILTELSSLYDKIVYSNFSGKKNIVGLIRNDCEISIEPGAQLEISITACEKIAEIEKIYNKFLNEVNAVLSKYDYKLVNTSYRPDACALEVPIIPKVRYICMDSHFKSVDTKGFCMMRNTCATQITIDYEDEDDCIKKCKVAAALSPIFYFLLDNSQIFERTKIDGEEKISPSKLIVPKRMARWDIWNHTDKNRCSVLPIMFDSDFSWKKYCEAIAEIPLIFAPANMPNLDNKEIAKYIGEEIFYDFYTPTEIICNNQLTTDEIKHVLSMSFHDVRLKNNIEIRFADTLDKRYLFDYIALIKAIFYNKKTLNFLSEMFNDITYSDFKDAGNELYNKAWDAVVYGKNIAALLNEIFEKICCNENENFGAIRNLIKSKNCVKDNALHEFNENNSIFIPVNKDNDNTQILNNIK